MPPASRSGKAARGSRPRRLVFRPVSGASGSCPGVDLRPGQVFFIELRGGEAGRVQPFPREAAEVVRRADAHGQQRREQPEERRVVRNEPARARPLREDAVLPVLFAQGEVRAECAKVGFERPGRAAGPARQRGGSLPKRGKLHAGGDAKAAEGAEALELRAVRARGKEGRLTALKRGGEQRESRFVGRKLTEDGCAGPQVVEAGRGHPGKEPHRLPSHPRDGELPRPQHLRRAGRQVGGGQQDAAVGHLFAVHRERAEARHGQPHADRHAVERLPDAAEQGLPNLGKAFRPGPRSQWRRRRRPPRRFRP